MEKIETYVKVFRRSKSERRILGKIILRKLQTTEFGVARTEWWWCFSEECELDTERSLAESGDLKDVD